jgi:hypothetical protein
MGEPYVELNEIGFQIQMETRSMRSKLWWKCHPVSEASLAVLNNLDWYIWSKVLVLRYIGGKRIGYERLRAMELILKVAGCA